MRKKEWLAVTGLMAFNSLLAVVVRFAEKYPIAFAAMVLTLMLASLLQTVFWLCTL